MFLMLNSMLRVFLPIGMGMGMGILMWALPPSRVRSDIKKNGPLAAD